METDTAQNFLLGPFFDLKRFVVGSVSEPTPSRNISEEGLHHARAVLTGAGCDLSGCTVENLHTWPTSVPATQVFDLLFEWKLWPRSAFFPCIGPGKQFAYRWFKVMPIVKMRRICGVKPQFIIYDIVWGIGSSGYHSFLLDPIPDGPQAGQTNVSIFTVFPPSPLFFEGLHDQVNFDMYRKLQA